MDQSKPLDIAAEQIAYQQYREALRFRPDNLELQEDHEKAGAKLFAAWMQQARLQQARLREND